MSSILQPQVQRNSVTAIRFSMNCFSGLPWIGGVIGACSAAWAERDQEKQNELLRKMLEQMMQEIKAISQEDSSPVADPSITFDPNSGTVLFARGISSLADNGILDFTIHFSDDFTDGERLFSMTGNGQVKLQEVEQGPGYCRFIFLAPCPEIVQITFSRISASSD